MSDIKKFAYTLGTVFTLTGNDYIGYYNIKNNTGYVGKYDQKVKLDNNQTIYGNNTTWLTVTRFYTDSGMTTPFNGLNSWYNEYNASTSYVYQIDTGGYITTTFDCSTL